MGSGADRLAHQRHRRGGVLDFDDDLIVGGALTIVRPSSSSVVHLEVATTHACIFVRSMFINFDNIARCGEYDVQIRGAPSTPLHHHQTCRLSAARQPQRSPRSNGFREPHSQRMSRLCNLRAARDRGTSAEVCGCDSCQVW